MKSSLVSIVLCCAILVACTSTGAPEPGERANQINCEVGEQRVCTGMTGSRIKKEEGTCSCSSDDNIDQF
jgi:hypothetical protein